MKPIKIVLAGTACSGKTTLGEALIKAYPQFTKAEEAIRTLVREYGVNIESGDASLQLAVLTLEMKMALEPGDYILDSSLLGSLGYTRYYKNHNQCDMDEATLKFQYNMTKKILDENVDLIIFLRTGEFPVVSDGFRVTNPDYIIEVDKIIEGLVTEMNLWNKVIVPTGSVEERVTFCRKYIDKIIANNS